MFLEECSSFWSLWHLQFSPRRAASSSGVGEVPGLLPIGSRSKAFTISSPFRLIKGAMHFWSSHTALQRTQVGTPNLCTAQSAQAKARIFSCIILRDSIGQEIMSTQPMKTGWRIPPTQNLLLCKGHPEGHSLPLRKVQGLGFTEVIPYGIPS